MLKKIDDNAYRLVVGDKNILIEILGNGSIEIYEEEDPGRTGFIFGDVKKFVFFINNITDIAEAVMEEMDNEDK